MFYFLNESYAHLITEGWRLVLHHFCTHITDGMGGFCWLLIILIPVQPLMWTQLHEYKVPCAGVSLFTLTGVNYTGLSTFALITVSSPRVWSAETV